jgi:hypothetical protein
MSSNLENTTADAAAETNPVQKWSDIEVEPRSPRGNHTPSSNQDHRAERPSFGRPHIQDEIDPDVLRLAEAFYLRYKSACHGVTRRPELQRLYEDTFESWVPKDANRSKTDFSKVLFALARGMKVVRVVDGGRQLVWRVFNNQRDERSERPDRRQDERPDRRQDHRRPQREFIPRDDRSDQRPERRQDERPERRQDERPDRRQDEHHMDQRRPQREFIPRDDRRQDERSDRRQDERSDRRQDERRPNLADIVSNQQKMIETLMAKVMKADN